MNVIKEMVVTVTVKLTAAEAELLKAMIQNPVSSDEPTDCRDLREKLFKAL